MLLEMMKYTQEEIYSLHRYKILISNFLPVYKEPIDNARKNSLRKNLGFTRGTFRA